MPKSRRDRKITLSKVEKKVGLEFKSKLIDRIRSSIDDYSNLFVFSIENNRNNLLKELREKWSHSKFYLGKNRVMSLALGRTDADEYSDNLHKVSRLLRNERGLLFTNQSESQVLEFFDNHDVEDFARTGGVATETVILPEGPLGDAFSFAMEPQLRAMGMPTALKKGIVVLLTQFTVCNKGETLTSNQARILKLLGHKGAKFKLNMVARWNKKEADFKILKEIPGLCDNEERDSKGESHDEDDEQEME